MNCQDLNSFRFDVIIFTLFVDMFFFKESVSKILAYDQDSVELYVLLTVHLGIILFNDQLDTQFFFFVYIYFNSLHV